MIPSIRLARWLHSQVQFHGGEVRTHSRAIQDRIYLCEMERTQADGVAVWVPNENQPSFVTAHSVSGMSSPMYKWDNPLLSGTNPRTRDNIDH